MHDTKCDKCKDKSWCWRCDECQSKPLNCFISMEFITIRDNHNHISNLYSDPRQYLICKMCNINEHILYCRFKKLRCRFCVHLHRYRIGRTKDRFKECIIWFVTLLIKMKCNNCKDKPWRQCCDKYLDSNYNGYVCEQSVKTKDYVNH